MLIIKKKYSVEKYFSKEVSPLESIKFVKHLQSSVLENKFGYFRYSKFTKIIELKEPDVLIMEFKSTTRNEIRKATKEGIVFSVEENIDRFIDFYNNFSKNMGLGLITRELLSKYDKNLVITKSVYLDEILTMHSYIIDNDSRRVRLLHSASLQNVIDDKKKRTLIGRSNRFLHFEDMKFFFKKGYLYYDLGGYAYKSEDKHLQNINKFKDSFGGELVENSNYIPWIFIIASKLKKLIKW